MHLWMLSWVPNLLVINGLLRWDHLRLTHWNWDFMLVIRFSLRVEEDLIYVVKVGEEACSVTGLLLPISCLLLALPA